MMQASINQLQNPPADISALIRRQLIMPVKRWLLLHYYIDTSYFTRQPDRVWLEKQLLPKLRRIKQGRILMVGCAPYTCDYPKHFNKGVEIITVDIDERNDIWGADKHLTADILKIDQYLEPASCDIVLLNGVFGHGVDAKEAQEATYNVLHRIMKPDGLLLVGWNHDLIQDPTGLPTCERLYYKDSYENLPQRMTFAESTHIFDFLRARPVMTVA
ncbi:class I SAM-dependent methyltransferase [Pontibacter ruber]|uniref:Class I SAM-dependent methyltransferase n=1 Tax=Pontibacter ruber TaxID=1343895 RepID=A0ABW5CW17_9BACT|nr:class I SAM-dependent methyltransferase [Pontibacter ruber]